MGKLSRFIKRCFTSLDPWLLLCALALSTVSLLMLYGISDSPMVNGMRLLRMQLIATAIGLAAMFFIANIDFEQILDKLWIPLLVLEIAALGITLVFGTAEGADKSWIFLFGISVQPSEFVKLTFILTFSKHLELVKNKINHPLALLSLALHAGAVIGLILLSGDLGVALVYGGIVLVMLYAAGLSYFWFLGGAFAAVCAVPLIWPRLREDQQLRIIYGFHPEEDPLGKGMQPLLGKQAIGNGGFFGQGLRGGEVYKRLYACENDFAFSSVCEKFGILVGILVIVLLILFVIRAVWIAKASHRSAGLFICAGIAGTVVVQTVENVGMCMAKLPVVGITLPFISYGGSSVLAMYMMLGMLQSVRAHRNSSIFAVPKK